MRWINQLHMRFQMLFSRSSETARLTDELQFHIDQQTAENIAAGMNSDEARHAAMRAFGNPTLLREQARETWSWQWLESIVRDVRYAVRTLGRTPGFTIIAVLTLALGIGANTAIFTVFNQVLLRKLPVRDPAQLVLLSEHSKFETGWLSTNGGSSDLYFAYPAYQRLRDGNHVLQGLAASAHASATLVKAKRADNIGVEIVSGNYFSVLGVRPVLGRLLTPADDRLHAGNAVAVLTAGYWQSHFASDPAVLNQQVQIGGKSFTIVGVVQYRGLNDELPPALYIPMAMEAAVKPSDHDPLVEPLDSWLTLIGRLAPGVTSAQADAQLNTLWWNWRRDVLTTRSHSIPDKKGWLQTHLSLKDGARGLALLESEIGQSLKVLEAMALVVLLIACANVANLLLVKAARRNAELALRGALGASRIRIFGQVLTEGLLLGVVGAAFGLMLGWLGLASVLKMIPQRSDLHRTLSAQMDWKVLLFCAAVGVATSLLFSIAPALLSMRVDLVRALHGQSAAVAGGGSSIRNLLVGAEIALSMALLVAAGMFGWTLYQLREINPGFTTTRVLTFSVDASALGKAAPEVRNEYIAIADAIRHQPGVSSVNYARLGLVSGDQSGSGIVVAGYTSQGNEPIPDRNAVTPGFFSAMQVPLLTGRAFTPQDTMNGQKVAIVDEAFVKHYFKGDARAALGRQFRFGGSKVEMQIVGVIPIIHATQIERAPSTPFLYLPYAQTFDAENKRTHSATFYIRTSGDPANLANAVRSIVHGMDRDLPISGLETMQEHLGDVIFEQRLMALLSFAMGGLALLLAAIGLYGVLAFAVAQRTREIGIRMALGADRGDVSTLVLRQTGYIVAAGTGAGVLLAWLGVRLLKSQIAGVHLAPLWLSACIVLGLLGVMLAASYLPARRAASVDPMEALRAE